MIKRFGAAWGQILTGVGFAAPADAACAETWPSKPVLLFVPYAAGGFTEQAAQAVGKALSFISPLPIYLPMKKAANCMSLAAIVMRHGAGVNLMMA